MSEDCNPMAVRLSREERDSLERTATRLGVGPYALLRQIVSGALNKLNTDTWQGTLSGWVMAIELQIDTGLQDETEGDKT